MEIQTKPFEVTDFSGGITDHILGGDPRRSAVLQNFIITVNKELEERYGYLAGLGVTGDSQLPSGQNRTNNLFTIIDETYLFGQSGRSLYYYDTINGWTGVTGPAGNPAIQGGDNLNQTTIAEFQRQFYLASDGGGKDNYGVAPSKVYRNTSNQWVARTAGLPRSWGTQSYSNTSLLQSCIALANAIRTAFIAHFQDSNPGNTYNASTIHNAGGYVQPNPNSLHAFTDKFSLSYLQSTTFQSGVDAEIPSTLPTPAPAATDQTSLFILVGALNNAFSHHVSDPGGAWSGTPGQGFYHYWMWFSCPTNSPYYANYNIPRGPNLLPSNPGTPAVAVTDLDNSNALLTCAAMLNDLVQKYNWHRMAVYTHSPFNDPAIIDRNRIGANKIGLVGSQGLTNIILSNSNNPPVVNPDYTDVFNYINNLRYAYNTHVGSGAGFGTTIGTTNSGLTNTGYHKSSDIPWLGVFASIGTAQRYLWYVTSNQCLLPTCTDIDSMYLLIFWLRCLYGGFHINDANSQTFIRTSMTTTAASASVTSLVRTDTSSNITATPPGAGGYNIWLPGTVAPTGVTFQGSGTGNNPISSFFTASGSGTATFQRQLSSSQSAVIGQYTDSLYHGSWNQSTNDVNTSSVTQEQSAAFLSTAVTSTGTDINSWLTLANEFFYCFATHVGGTGNNTAQSHVWGSTLLSMSFQSNFISGMPNPFFIGTVSQASYAFFYSYSYTVEPNGIQYLTVGNPVLTTAMDIAVSYPVGYSIPSQTSTVYPAVNAQVTRQNTLQSLPTLSNDAATNYDTSNVVLNIYRTINGGTTYYKVASVANGTASYSESINDSISSANSSALINNQQIYTTGGTVGFDQAPQSKFVTILLGIAYYGGVFDSGQFFPQRIRQSIPYSPDHSPATFFLDLDDEITGMSSTRSNVIAFTKNGVYRVSGQFNNQGQGQMASENISDGIGCLNAKSIVKTEVGVFFAGTDGFYYTDAFQIIKVSLEIDLTYASLTLANQQSRTIFGAYDKINRRIWWSMKLNQADTDNNITFVYYMNFGVRPSGVFTTVINLGTSGNYNWSPSSMVFWKGFQVVGDSRGYILRNHPFIKTDPVINPAQAVSSWQTTAIPFEYRSLAIPFGSTGQRKWLSKIHVVGNNVGNAAIQINAIRDLNTDQLGISAMSPINFANNPIWGDARWIWNGLSPTGQANTATVWNPPMKMDVWRRFPQTSLRSDYMQIQMLPASLAIYSSSANFPTGSNCTVNNVAKTATILTPSGYTNIYWPNDVVGYNLYFDTDGYTQGYAITAVSNAVITYADAGNLSPSVGGNGTQWVIRGTQKNQRARITSYVVNYAYFGDKTQAFPGKYSNEGAGNLGENPS